MPAIFVSHSSLDPKEADDIKASLARLGFERVFLDFDKASGIGAGESWEKRLYEALSRSHAVILVLTPNWLASKWCFAELTQARALGKVIIPVICKPLGERFVLPDVQAVDLLDWKKDGLARLEQRLHAIADELARGFTLDPNRPPFPGIHAFEAEDAAIYFGRDDETRAVIERLDARRTQGGARFLIVIGASGSGKSSLLKAGVLPQLARRRAHWLALPPIRPEKAPLEAVAKAIAYQLGKPDDWEAWHGKLSGPDAIDEIEKLLKQVRVGDARAATVLLPIDQFEEVFTVATPPERSAFMRLLAGALDGARGLALMVLATGRSDVLEGLTEAAEMARTYETVALVPMPLARMPLLVEGPAAVAGLNVEKGLAEQIARDVESPEALPLLAHTLWLLYRRGLADKRLSLAEYTSLGDPQRGLNPIQNSVRLVADQALTGVQATQAELAALRDAFVPHLVRVRLDDGKRVRQPAPLAGLPSASRRLIAALTEARLLTTREGLVEATHEALFKAWPTLDQWLTEEHAFLTDLERIRGACDVWAQAPADQQAGALLHGLLLSRARDWLLKYPQRFVSADMEPLRAFIAASARADDAAAARSQRLRRRIFQGMAAAAVIFAAVAAIAGWQYWRAEQARAEAERNFDIAKQAADQVAFRIAGDLRDVEGMRVESVRRILTTAQAMMDGLARAAPNDLQLQASRGGILSEFAATYLSAGDLASARAAADESLAIARKLAAADPGNARQHDLSVSLHNVGDVRLAAGDRAGAFAAYDEGLAIMRKLAAADPGNQDWQRDLGVGLNRIGDVRLAAGDRVDALAAYDEGLAIMRELAAADPTKNGWQLDLSVSLDKVGEVRLLAGDRAGALAAYEESLAIRRKLVAANPENASWQRDVYVSLTNVGDARRAAGDRTGALAANEESLAIMRKLAAEDPGNAGWKADVSISLDRVGDARLAAGDLAGALAAYEESLAMRRNLAAADPGNAGWQRGVSVSLNLVGNVREAAGDGAGALAAYEESLAIARKLAAADPGNAGWQHDVSLSLNKVGDVRLAAGDRAGALAAYEEDLAIMRKLTAADPGNVRWQTDLVAALYKISTASDPSRARAVLREALAIAEALAREGKLTVEQQDWPQELRDELAKLPPEAAGAK
jgi:tetratricopeptide (TPR) repeat protein